MERLVKENFTITNVIIAYTSKLPFGKIRTLNTTPRPNHCFAYVISGECDYYTDEGRTFTVKSGDILYLAQGQRYVINVKTTDYSVIVINFLLDTTDKLRSDCLKTDNPEIKSAFEQILVLYNSESTVKNAKLCSLANKIYATLCEDKNYSTTFDKQKVRIACDYIAQNFENLDFTCAKLAKECKISDVHLRRLFKKVLGISPIQYLANLRFDKARKLLTLSDLSVSQIALECGFADVYYFSKAYKKRYGHSPSKIQSTATTP
ncbi:MAG: helix-turn-helix domain-containing protein [Clostridiales bacterium]|nr:helix-turn-helix domain-containing protein [Clostridiales bacterium]